MRYCKKCLEPDTRPDCVFDDEGICYPCRYRERMAEIDWAERRRELEEIAAWGKARNVSGYDCIIPVSGGKDSHRQALYARDELGLTPLLVTCAYPPEQQSERGARNMANLIALGFDAYYVSPAPENWRQFMRIGFTKFGNWCKSTELALFATAPKIATYYRIPLLIYGENPLLTWGGSWGSSDGNANRMKDSHTLKGGDLSSYLDEQFDLLDLYWYRYPSDREMDLADLRLIYLGYYIPDFDDWENSRIAIEHGLECRTGPDAIPEDTGQVNSFEALDEDFVIVNSMLKHFKFGFGKASEQCSVAVRTGIMTRQEAVELTRKYDGKCAQRYAQAFCNYLGISEDEFWETAESYRNREIWEPEGNTWKLKTPLE